MARHLQGVEHGEFDRGASHQRTDLTDRSHETRRQVRGREIEGDVLQGADTPEPSTASAETDMLALLSRVLDAVEEVRDLIVSQHQIRDYYGTDEVAKILNRAPWTVREWCRLGRVRAQKRYSGRWRSQEWVIPHAELLRIQKEGLLPLPKY